MFTTDINAAIEHAAATAYPLFKFYDWKYALTPQMDTNQLVKTIRMLVESCERQAAEATDEERWISMASSGRFQVIRLENDEEGVSWEISLNLVTASEGEKLDYAN